LIDGSFFFAKKRLTSQIERVRIVLELFRGSGGGRFTFFLQKKCLTAQIEHARMVWVRF
jgi:hypothetical protein